MLTVKTGHASLPLRFLFLPSSAGFFSDLSQDHSAQLGTNPDIVSLFNLSEEKLQRVA